MTTRLSVPARINILGNPADGNEGDFATISAAVNLRAHATIDKADNFKLEMVESQSVEVMKTNSRIPMDGRCDLLVAALNRLIDYSGEFREKCTREGFKLQMWSEVPRQSGLGGSSLFVLLTLAALREHYELDKNTHNNYLLAELAQRAEAIELGITAGFADRYVPLIGGLAYIDYRGKLYQKEIFNEPFATCERLDVFPDTLSLVAVTTGVQHNSGDVHGRMRPRYLQENDSWKVLGGPPPPMVEFMTSAWECAWRGKIAILESDYVTFGKLMNRNHVLVDSMMRYCGFSDGAGWSNNIFIESANNSTALGSKLTGAGGGGSVFALVKREQEDELMEIWRKTAQKHSLHKAQLYKIEISDNGLLIDHDTPKDIITK